MTVHCGPMNGWQVAAVGFILGADLYAGVLIGYWLRGRSR